MKSVAPVRLDRKPEQRGIRFIRGEGANGDRSSRVKKITFKLIFARNCNYSNASCSFIMVLKNFLGGDMGIDNSQQILNDVLFQQRLDVSPEVSDQSYFEIFCAAQILKDFDLSYDEIEAGIVDGEHDGGVDSVYAFVNGELIAEDFDTNPFKKDVRIELHIIQSKTSGGVQRDSN